MKAIFELINPDNTLSVNMNRLRRKFEEVGVKNCIVTHRARGYALDG